jgi:hypothetical protein
MTRQDIRNEYFDWLSSIVCGDRYAKQISYKNLLAHLHNIEFSYIIPRDQNRAEEGEALRYRFAITQGYEDSADEIVYILDGPCSVFEMMVALAIYCEENIMDDPHIGNRTGQWFWNMIANLGIGGMQNDRYDPRHVDYVIERFLNRDYEPDGRGGLFRIVGCEYDLRDMEIWKQLCWYLDTIV